MSAAPGPSPYRHMPYWSEAQCAKADRVWNGTASRADFDSEWQWQAFLKNWGRTS